MPRPRADRLPDSGATMPMISVPLLVSQLLLPPPPAFSCRFVPHAVSPRAPARSAAATIVRLRVMCQTSFRGVSTASVVPHHRSMRLSLVESVADVRRLLHAVHHRPDLF